MPARTASRRSTSGATGGVRDDPRRAGLLQRRRIARRSAAAPRVIAVDAVELGGGVAAEIFLGIRRLFRVLAQVALPLPAAPLAASPLQLALYLSQLTL